MKIKATLGLLSVFAVSMMFVGSTFAASYYAVYADADIYGRNRTVAITYEGLGGNNYQYNARIVIFDESNVIVATNSLPDISNNIVYTWDWNHIGNYGGYDGIRASAGTYYITMGYFYGDGTYSLWGETGFYMDEFALRGGGRP
jgi:hypothetical protein